MKSKLIIYLGIMLAILTACSSEKPTHLEPHLAVFCGCEDAGVPRDGDVALAEVAELRLHRLGFGNVHLLVDIFRES